MRLRQQNSPCDTLRLKLVKHLAHDMRATVPRCDEAGLAKALCIVQASDGKIAAVSFGKQMRAIGSQHFLRAIRKKYSAAGQATMDAAFQATPLCQYDLLHLPLNN